MRYFVVVVVALTMMCTQWKGEIRRPRRIFEMVKCAMHSEIDIEPILLYVFSLSSVCTQDTQCDRT